MYNVINDKTVGMQNGTVRLFILFKKKEVLKKRKGAKDGRNKFV